MSPSIRALAPAAVIAAAIAIMPTGASASPSVGPPALDFGSVPVGTASSSLPVGLTSTCSFPVGATCPGFALDAYYVHVSTAGDFTTTDDCPDPLGLGLNVLIAGCTINVTFKPAAPGTRTGTLDTGTTDITGLIPGPTVSLAGAGTVPSGYPAANGGGGGSASKSKKCKKKRKHRSAQVAKKKKCKKA